MRVGSRIAVAATSLTFVGVPAVALANGPGDEGGSFRSNPAKQCRTERSMLGKSRFDEMYGTNENHRNAFGKCVSKHARQDRDDQQSAQAAANKRCRDAESTDAAAFRQKYGTDRNDRDAFGKCVSSQEKAIADRDENEQMKAEENAAKTCSSEESSSRTNFEQKYDGKNVRDAFGKCVSQHAKAQEQQEQQQQSSDS